jgi:hypothetical protein
VWKTRNKWLEYKTIILPNDLYGCETWTLPLNEEHGLWVLEKGKGTNERIEKISIRSLAI